MDQDTRTGYGIQAGPAGKEKMQSQDGQLVRCDICGKYFDFKNAGKYDDRKKWFICPGCMVEADAGIKKSPFRPFTGRTAAKLIIGGIFLAFGISEYRELDNLLFGLALGIPLLLWAIIPWARYIRGSKRQAELEERLYEEKIRLRKEQENAPRLCPACGAIAHGKVCEYCGTRLNS